MSVSRGSTRPALASRISRSSNSFNGKLTGSPRTNTSCRSGSRRTAPTPLASGPAPPLAPAGPPPEHGAHAGHQLAEAVGLGHVVVGADLQPDDGIDLGPFGG